MLCCLLGFRKGVLSWSILQMYEARHEIALNSNTRTARNSKEPSGAISRPVRRVVGLPSVDTTEDYYFSKL